MSADLTDLSRRVAVTGRWSPRLGTVVVMGDGTRFRVVREGYECSRVLADIPHRDTKCLGVAPLFDASDGERPDLTDEVTALSLLADLPPYTLTPTSRPEGWKVGGAFGGRGATLAEAIARAWLDAYGG